MKKSCPPLRVPTPPPEVTLLDVAQGLRADSSAPVDEALLGDAVLRVQNTMDARPAREVNVVSWNVWFDAMAFDDRLVGLVDELLSVAPDVVGLQEVTQRFAAAIRGSAVLAALYDISANNVGDYGCLMLARSDLRPQFREVGLPSNMGRSLLLCECHMVVLAGSGGALDIALKTQRPSFVVGTVHLESLNQEVMRQKQLEVCAAELRRYRGGACLCGDFNFDATRTWGEWRRSAASLTGPALALARLAAKDDGRATRLENENLQRVMPEFVDCWPAVHGSPTAALAAAPVAASVAAPPPGAAVAPAPSGDDVMGFTFDGVTNPGCCADPQERMRYDRVMCRVGAGAVGASEEGSIRKMLAFAKSALQNWAGSGPKEECALKPVGITMLGRRCIPTSLAGAYYEGVQVKASDHYGLSARLQFEVCAAEELSK